MSSKHPTNQEPTPPTNGQPTTVDDKGLPPVSPPSGRFIAQLFLVPGLIVVVLVLIWLAGNYLVSERRSADYFLDNLDSPNEDIRWRAAADLAQVLKRPESLEMASDPKFALDLADRLQFALKDLEQREKDLANDWDKMTPKERLKTKKNLEPQQNYVLFLISSLGDFTVPVGAPLLSQIATNDKAAAEKENVLRRRRAVWALANLGDKMKRFKNELKDEQREKIIATLKEQQKKAGSRGEWAKTTYLYLTKNQTLGVDATLAKCAEAEDSFLRELVAMALNFWDGPEVIPTLIKLSQDDGHGTRIKITEDE